MADSMGGGSVTSLVLFLEGTGEWGHGKKSPVFSQSHMADFRFPSRKSSRMLPSGKVPMLGPLPHKSYSGPLPLHMGLAPSFPNHEHHGFTILRCKC